MPAVLAFLRRELYNNKGLESEGIFRLSGDETEMMSIKGQLNKGKYLPIPSVDNAATLLKVIASPLPCPQHQQHQQRWFGELPQRIFAALPQDCYEECLHDPAACRSFPERLAEPHRTLFLWLSAILVAAGKNEVTKMTASNLCKWRPSLFASIPEFLSKIAVCVAPNLVVLFDDPMQDFQATGQVVAILQKYLSYQLSG